MTEMSGGKESAMMLPNTSWEGNDWTPGCGRKAHLMRGLRHRPVNVIIKEWKTLKGTYLII